MAESGAVPTARGVAAAVAAAAERPRRPERPRGRARVEYLAQRTRLVLRARWDVLMVIAIGGAIGSLARWGLSLLLPHPVGAFPWATSAVNVSGCFLLGLLLVLVIDVRPPSRYARPFLGVGVLGSYTTFSSFMLEARDLLVAGRTALAGQYVFGSLVAGMVAVWLGVTSARLSVRLMARRGASRRRAPADRASSTLSVAATRSPR